MHTLSPKLLVLGICMLGLSCTDADNDESSLDSAMMATVDAGAAGPDAGAPGDMSHSLDSSGTADVGLEVIDASGNDAVDGVIGEDSAPEAEVDAGAIVRVNKSLVIALDGVRPDALEHANMPHFDMLVAGTWQPGYRGAYAPDAQTLYDAATLSGPNHAAIMTGAIGVQHGVTGNGDVGGGDYASFPHYLAQVEAARPGAATAYLFTWGTDLAIPSGADYVKDGDDASNVERVAAILRGVHEDEAGDLGTAWSRGTDPDAVFLFLDDPDHAGHGVGFEPSVSGYITELEEVDGQLGALMDALVERPTWDEENWQIIITSDHGGYHTSHGGMTAPEQTIPFLVVSRDVTQGRLPQGTRNFDTVPTVLRHLDLPVPEALTGQARGGHVRVVPGAGLGRDLVGYYPFEGSLDDATGRGNDGLVGPESDVAPTLVEAGGKFGGYLSISDQGGGDDASSYVSLGRPADYLFEDEDAFSVTVWFRSRGQQGGDPVIIGNKDWDSGLNSGWLLLANEGANNSFGLNFADGQRRADLEDVDYADTDWWFLASVFNPDGLALVFCGDSRGTLRWMALDVAHIGSLDSPLPLNLGQDGTGRYGHNLAGDLDDLAIWRRRLSFAEIEALYQRGVGSELATQR